MNILLISYGYSDKDMSSHHDINSEAISTFYLASEIKKKHKIEILTKDKSINNNITTIKCNKLFESLEIKITGRGAGQLKLDYPQFIYKAYKHAKKIVGNFDIIHQISPKSLRYPSPFGNLEIPLILGPIGGSISFPEGFNQLKKEQSFLSKLRDTDKLRLKYDPFMVNTLKTCSKIILTCNAAKKVLPEQYQDKAVVIPQGINTPYDSYEQIKNESNNDRYIFSSGRLVPYKAMDYLIKAYAKISAEIEDVKLIITGDGPEKNKLSTLINDLGMNDKIQLLGKVPKESNMEYMKNSLFCVFPALNEAFGVVNLEAMSYGKPVIVTDWGGPADIVENGVNGFKIMPHNEEQFISAMAEKIRTLAINSELVHNFGINAFNLTKEKYSWETVGNSINQVYESVR